MKTLKQIFIVCLAIHLNVSHAQQLGIFEFNTGTTCETIDRSVTSQPANALFSDMSVSSHNPCADNSLEYLSVTWTNSPTPNHVDFFHFFSITASGGYVLNLTSINFDLYRPASPGDKGPDTAAVYASVDGSPYTKQGNNFIVTQVKTTFTCALALSSNGGGNISFKITGWQAQNSGTNSRLLIDNMRVSGTVDVVPLPVELLAFTAETAKDKVLLHWATASEMNNDFFTVEKTKDGKNFFCAAKVKGAGNSSVMMEYFAADNNPYEGTAYYRLKQTDFNGTYQYSKMIEVNFSSENPVINIYPNPTHADACITFSGFSEKEILVAVYDCMGNEIFSKIVVLGNYGNECVAMDVWQKLSPGVYFIMASSNNKLYKQKLVVQ